MKKIMYCIEEGGKKNFYEARTPEGAVKKHFAGFPIPTKTSDGGWKGISVYPKNGYKRIVDPYKLPPFTWKYDRNLKKWVQ